MVVESNVDSNVFLQEKPKVVKKAPAAAVRNGNKKDSSSSDEADSDDADSSDEEVSYCMHQTCGYIAD